MTHDEWLADVFVREKANEGVENKVYKDSKQIDTIGIGFNLTRADARSALASVGAAYDQIMAGGPLTDAQVLALFEYSFAPIISQARASLQPMHFDLLSDARRAAIVDLVFNMGEGEWFTFHGTRGLIDEAVHTLVTLKDPMRAHMLFGKAADHLMSTPYAQQVGARAKRNCEMIRTSEYVSPHAFES